ncbi:MAG: hypothetical protein WCI12_02550 [Actinomycetes bacterium]
MKRHLLPAGAVVAMLASLPGAAPAAAATERAIAVVVDFGTGGSFDGFVRCVHEPEGATDAQALVDALAQEGLAGATFASSGLICSLGGIPTTGCGTRTPAGYSYWAYFHGSNSQWSFANDGPAERKASPVTVQGWRFESMGRGNPTDPGPRSQPDVAGICGEASPVPATTPTTEVRSASALSGVGIPEPDASAVGEGARTGRPAAAGEPANALTTATTGLTTTTVPSGSAGAGSTHRSSTLVATRVTRSEDQQRNSWVGTIVVLGAIVAGAAWSALLWRRRQV